MESGATDIKSGTLNDGNGSKNKRKAQRKIWRMHTMNEFSHKCQKINSFKQYYKLGDIFDNPIYGLSDEYNTIDEFRAAVFEENYSAINKVKRICGHQHLSMFANAVDKFEEWVKDVIAANGLKDTGIVFIWDEFTGFLRDCGDDNVLQRLSEFCKQPNAPFFLCLIVHRDLAWVDISLEVKLTIVFCIDTMN